MTDADWPERLEVLFDPGELHRERMAALRTQRIAAWGWLLLTVLALVALVIPLFRADVDGLWLLTAVWVALLAGMVLVTVKCFAVLARCSVWTDGQQPKTAMRLNSDGLWLAEVSQFGWETIDGLRTRSTLGRHYLIVDLKPGILPDSPTILGLTELRPPSRCRHRLPPRGPRLLPLTVAIKIPDLRAAIEHYSNGKTLVR